MKIPITPQDKKIFTQACISCGYLPKQLFNNKQTEEYVEMRRDVSKALKSRGWGTARIARSLGLAFGTIKNYLKDL